MNYLNLLIIGICKDYVVLPQAESLGCQGIFILFEFSILSPDVIHKIGG
jgi:hypothetical protein